MPDISVILTCYNHERFASAALDSIERQQGQLTLEVIAADDASEDATPALLEQFQRRSRWPVRLVLHRNNAGVTRTVSECLNQARGDLVAILSGDDVWDPDKLERQVEALRTTGDDVAVCYSDMRLIDGDGRTLPGTFMHDRVSGHTPDFRLADVLGTRDIFELLLRLGNFLPATSALVRRQALLDAGGYDTALAYEDFDMWLRLSERHRFLYLDEPLGCYRVLSSSLSASGALPFLRDNALIYGKFVRARWPAPYVARRQLLRLARDGIRARHPDAGDTVRAALRGVFAAPWPSSDATVRLVRQVGNSP